MDIRKGYYKKRKWKSRQYKQLDVKRQGKEEQWTASDRNRKEAERNDTVLVQ